MHKKRFAFLSVVLAMLCAFALVFAACDNGESSGETPSTGDPFEGYVEVPAEETSVPATLTLDKSALSVAYMDTAQVTATVGNAADGTVTWSVEADGQSFITIPDDEKSMNITADNAVATVTLTGAAFTNGTAYTLTATFTAADDAENTASASCEVTVGTRTVTVEVSGTASALYTDGEAAEKSATLTAAVTGLSADETATVNWAVTEGAALVDLSATTGTEITVTAKDDAAVGSVTITASVTYNDGKTVAQTASGMFTLSVTRLALNQLAFVDFENADGRTLEVESGYGTGVVTAHLDQDEGLTTEYVKSGSYAFKVTGDGDNADEDEHFTIDFASVTDVVVQLGDTLSFSFWYYQTGQGIGDWSAMVSVNGFDGYRATFLNMWAGAGAYPVAGGGVLEEGYNATSLTAGANDQQWHHIILEMNATDGVMFYLDGDLVCTYPRTVSDAANLFDVFQYWMALPEDGNNINTNFVFFGDIEGGAVGSDLYVDDVRITKNISAAELYAAATATE